MFQSKRPTTMSTLQPDGRLPEPGEPTGIDFIVAYDTLIRGYARIHCAHQKLNVSNTKKGQEGEL